MEDDYSFDFTKWIAKYELNDISECFTDHDMTTVDTLNIENTNLCQLLSDQRILSSPHLISNIVNALQSMPMESKPIIRRRLIFTTQKEQDIFINIEHYINRLNELENELQNRINECIFNRKQSNNTNIDEYTLLNKQILDEIRTQINDTTNKLHMILTQIEGKLQTQINEYRNNIKYIDKEHTESIEYIDNTFNKCESIIADNIKYFVLSIQKCKDIVSKYEDNIDDNDDDYSLQRCGSDLRENEIIKIGDDAIKNYNNNLMLLNDKKQILNQYIENELILNMKQIYSVTINDNIYKNIQNNINKLIQVRSINDPEIQSNVVDTISNNSKPIEQNVSKVIKKEVKVIKKEVKVIKKDPPLNPPVAFAQNHQISLVDIEENKEPMKEVKVDVAVPNIHQIEGEEEEEKTPPPYNPKARPASMRKILNQKQPKKEKKKVPKQLPMRKHQSADVPKRTIVKIDPHLAYKEALETLSNKESSPKPVAFDTFWQCTVCTYGENPGTFLMCEVCNSSRQLSSVPMMRGHSASDGPPYLPQSKSGFHYNKDKGESPLAMEDRLKDKKNDKGLDVKRAQTVQVKKKESKGIFGWRKSNKNKRKSGKKGKEK